MKIIRTLTITKNKKESLRKLFKFPQPFLNHI